MSQQNTYPPFQYNFNEPYFNAQPSQGNGNATFPQWSQPGSRATPNTISSSSTPVRMSRPVHDARQSHLSLLVPPNPRPRPTVPSASSADPMSRWYDDAPWSSERMRNPGVPTGRPSYTQSQMDYGSYRSRPGSEVGSTARSDSGYYTHHPRSVISSDPEQRIDQDLPQELLQLGNINVTSASSDVVDPFRHQSETGTQYSTRSSKEFTCPRCKDVSKCKSDHKKHMLKHDKPYVCDISNCRRAGKGFTTINDLARHKKSVHRINAFQNSYQCASENCRNKEKVWPRLDNFKQHLARMHKDEDEQDLIRRSAYRGPDPSPSVEALSIAPMDTTLAGIGTEKQFAGNDFDDPRPGISLTPDQDPSPWTSFDQSSRDFAVDVDQANHTTFSHGSQRSGFGREFRLSSQSTAFDMPNTPGIQTQQDSRLEILADAATVQTSPVKDAPQSPLHLSNAPQTKAEQQRQALQKLSKVIARDIQNSPSEEPMDLEDVLLRVLYGAANIGGKDDSHSAESSSSPATVDDMNFGGLTKGEAIKASQAISNLIKQSGKSAFAQSRPRRPPKGFPSPNTKTCHLCGMTLARSCDLKKHMKRHTRPYGCTYPKCHKRFGAKSDWKRHENSQHFQLESFRCQQPSQYMQRPCGELFHRVEMCKKHLESDHRMTEPDLISHELKAIRIGKNGQGQFWCGFCEKIVKLEKKRNAAWDERFDHIDRHFNKEKRSIEEWWCMEAKKRKGEVLKEVNRANFDEDDMDMFGVDETDHSPPSQEAEMGLPMDAPIPSNSTAASSQASSKKRSAPSDAFGPSPLSKRSKGDISRYCCSCQSGPFSTHLYPNCVSCDHHFCSGCMVVGFHLEPEGSMMLGEMR